MTTSMLNHHNGGLRASDADREKALGLLRDHWLAGRLTLDEYEERCEEATGGCFIDDLRWSIRELPYPLPEHGVEGLTPAAAPVAQKPAPPPAPAATAVLSLVLATMSLLVAWIPFVFLLTLPASTWAWGLGRRVRRADRTVVRTDIRALATVGEVLGIIATTISCLMLAACGILIAAA